ncbi:MAG: hypothetical protein FWE34_05085 [Defluviitaleaceae bacterium]|nr:hypothetical protein [Defluviitaleaceae bacterium]
MRKKLLSMLLVVVILLTAGTNAYADPGDIIDPRIPRIIIPCPDMEG